ncbi:MAG: tail fiber domain-containing protein, partial [Caldicoprobacterales bacterium]
FLQNDVRELLGVLGDVAFMDKIEKAMLGETIIIGGYIRTELIAANTIVGNKISSDAIAARHIQAGAITADKIDSNAIAARHIQAGAITEDKIDVQTLSVISANLGTITDGSLNIGNGAFKVSSAGKLEATGADITGKITATSGSFPASLITGALTANQINVDTLSAISANLGTITAGNITGVTITGGTVRTGSGNNRIELSSNLLRAYSDGTRRVQLDYDSLDFYDSKGQKGGEILSQSDAESPWEGLNIKSPRDKVIRLESGPTTAYQSSINILGYYEDNDEQGEISIISRQSTTMNSINVTPTNIYLSKNPTVLSDTRFKREQCNIPELLKDEFRQVQPKMYKTNDDRWHFGYIAQDVERALYKYVVKKVGFKKAREYMKKFDVLYKDESYLSLVYAEIEALKMVAIESRINEIENRLSLLETSKGV